MTDFSAMSDAELETAVADAAREAERLAKHLLALPPRPSSREEYITAKLAYHGKHRFVHEGTAELRTRYAAGRDPQTAYTIACDRYNAIAEALATARNLSAAFIDLLEAQYAAASRELAKYEISPGVPKPEFDTLADGNA